MPAGNKVEDILGSVVGATGYRYNAKDSAGNRMDTAKIITNPAGGYLSVYHDANAVNLASSTDLLTWTFQRTLDAQASQPTIHALPTGGFLTATEYNNRAGSGGKLRLRHYASLAALRAGSFDRERTIARTLSRCNEGTPTIYSVSLLPDIDTSVIEIGFHYHRNCDVDRQARGVLTNFTAWQATADPDLDQALTAAAAAQGHRVDGNIGDRDTVVVDNVRYNLHEVQYVKNDFGTWRPYLYTWQTGSAAFLPITTHGGSTAFANPTVSTVTAPSGDQAVVASMFVPGEGAAPGEAGQLIYYREYPTTPDPVPATGLSATYFDHPDFTGSSLVRIDRQVDFDFGTGAPSPNLGADQFSVRWSGRVLADTTETYTFYTQTDDGVRLWVDGALLVDDWTDHGIVENSGTIALAAGVMYDLKMEYYDNSGGGFVTLLWSSPTTPKTVVPADHLYQPTNGLTARYFAGITLDGPPRTRNDTCVNFDWSTGFGDPNTGREYFSVRWTGRVVPQFSETYRFYTNTDDGVRLWVDGALLVDDWTDHGPTENSGTIALVAGQEYDVRMDYYERGGGALAQLWWSSPSVPKQIVPRESLKADGQVSVRVGPLFGA